MSTHIRLGQVFYGRGENGYGILGASPLGKPHGEAVAALCQAIGSPDRSGEIKPFLVSKRAGGNVLMVRAFRGEDPAGRATLFFHVLVAPEAELAAAGLDAFILADQQAFLSRMPKGDVRDLSFPGGNGEARNPRGGQLRLPAFVAADVPLEEEVRRELGGETLSLNWSTYSYRALNGFDLCVHSSIALAPAWGNRYAFKDGRFVEEPKAAPTPLPQQPVREENAKPSLVLKASLCVNAALAVALAATLAMHGGQPPKPVPPEPPGPPVVQQKTEMSEQDAFAKWGEAWKEQWRRELAAAFEKSLDGKAPILNFDDIRWKKQFPFAGDGAAKPPEIYWVLKAYVSFVNTEIAPPKAQN